jgi:hypothetical protein
MIVMVFELSLGRAFKLRAALIRLGMTCTEHVGQHNETVLCADHHHQLPAPDNINAATSYILPPLLCY